jgi:hypothetical protein
MRFRGISVATNTPPGVSQRAPGGLQASVWFEPLVHEASKKLGIDQVALHKMNAPEGQALFGLVPPNTPPGRPRSKLTSCYVKEALDQGAELFGWDARKGNSGKRTGTKAPALDRSKCLQLSARLRRDDDFRRFDVAVGVGFYGVSASGGGDHRDRDESQLAEIRDLRHGTSTPSVVRRFARACASCTRCWMRASRADSTSLSRSTDSAAVTTPSRNLARVSVSIRSRSAMTRSSSARMLSSRAMDASDC